MKSLINYLVALIIGLILFIGLALLGWGLRQLPQFFDLPARSAYVIVILFLQLFAVAYNPQTGRHRGQGRSGITRNKIDLILIQLFSLSIVFLAPFSDKRSIATLNFGDGIRYLGLVLIVLGFLLMQIAEKYLDKQFSVEVAIQADHQLIQTGPYAYVRHPRYLGIVTFFLGISLVFQSLLAIILVAGLFLVLIWRVNAEEALMKKEFGEQWDAYCEKSWRMIPFVF